MEFSTTFELDHLIRNEKNIPVGRVVPRGEFIIGSNIDVALAEIPNIYLNFVETHIFYIDGIKYKFPEKIHFIKKTKLGNKAFFNNIVLELA